MIKWKGYRGPKDDAASNPQRLPGYENLAGNVVRHGVGEETEGHVLRQRGWGQSRPFEAQEVSSSCVRNNVRSLQKQWLFEAGEHEGAHCLSQG